MKKFKFSLQSVLNMKIALEKQQKGELGVVEQRILGFLRELDDIYSRYETKRGEFNEKIQTEGMSPLDFMTYSNGFAALREKAETQKKKIAVAEEEKKRIQKKLVETMSERKMYEKLKEKQLEEYKAEVRRDEAKTIDDFLSNKISSEV